MGEKTRDQLLSELLELQKELEKKVQHQDQMIKRFQMLTANEGLFSQIIDYCPYPIAVFTPQGILETINNAFADETEVNSKDLEAGKLSIYNYISNNTELNNAIRQTFNGKTRFFEGLMNPLSGFAGMREMKDPPYKSYKKVIVFPIPSEDGAIMHGVAVFMI